MDLIADKCLPVSRIADIEAGPTNGTWLIRSLWSKGAVGFCGGPPKCRKSWLGLEAAVAIASGRPCLGRFEVEDQGTALVYMAEDKDDEVKERVRGICAQRQIDFSGLDLHVITSSRLRLDDADDREGLVATIDKYKPKFLLLDPLVRLHSLDENSAREISALLGFFRWLQREFDVSIMVAHHANKKTHGRPGERLRGSSDFYAFADSSVYIFPSRGAYELTVEHRAAAPIEPFLVDLTTVDGATALNMIDGDAEPPPNAKISHGILDALRSARGPMTRGALRAVLKIQNQRLGDCLDQLVDAGLALRTAEGWIAVDTSPLFHPP